MHHHIFQVSTSLVCLSLTLRSDSVDLLKSADELRVAAISGDQIHFVETLLRVLGEVVTTAEELLEHILTESLEQVQHGHVELVLGGLRVLDGPALVRAILHDRIAHLRRSDWGNVFAEEELLLRIPQHCCIDDVAGLAQAGKSIRLLQFRECFRDDPVYLLPGLLSRGQRRRVGLLAIRTRRE